MLGGMIQNIRMAQELLPGWQVRVYLDRRLANFSALLTQCRAQVVLRDIDKISARYV